MQEQCPYRKATKQRLTQEYSNMLPPSPWKSVAAQTQGVNPPPDGRRVAQPGVGASRKKGSRTTQRNCGKEGWLSHHRKCSFESERKYLQSEVYPQFLDGAR